MENNNDLVQMNVRIPLNLKKWAEKKAKKDKRSLNSTIAFILEELKKADEKADEKPKIKLENRELKPEGISNDRKD